MLELAEVEGKLDILENGWRRHDRLGRNFKCATGYRPSNSPPVKPVGLSSASQKAIQRWSDDRFATQVYHYEDHNLVCLPKPSVRLKSGTDASNWVVGSYLVKNLKPHCGFPRTIHCHIQNVATSSGLVQKYATWRSVEGTPWATLSQSRWWLG